MLATISPWLHGPVLLYLLIFLPGAVCSRHVYPGVTRKQKPLEDLELRIQVGGICYTADGRAEKPKGNKEAVRANPGCVGYTQLFKGMSVVTCVE